MLRHRPNKEFYDQNGYFVAHGLIPERLITKVREATKVPGKALDRWKWFEDSSIIELAYEQRILALLRTLYDAEPFPFQTLNFDISPAIGLHADTIHFNTDPYGWMCGVWVALEDATLDNGPLQYYPGSHELPVVTFEDIGLTPSIDPVALHRNLGMYSQWLDKRNIECGYLPETFVCPRGTVLVWHANLMHKSIIPKAGTTRATQVTHYYFKVPNISYTVPAFGRDHLKRDAFALEESRTRWTI